MKKWYFKWWAVMLYVCGFIGLIVMLSTSGKQNIIAQPADIKNIVQEQNEPQEPNANNEQPKIDEEQKNEIKEQDETASQEIETEQSKNQPMDEYNTTHEATSSPAKPLQEQTNAECDIKGNISSTGEKVYHVPGCASYSRTIIDEDKGEKWFCSEAEAISAGWRKALNCP